MASTTKKGSRKSKAKPRHPVVKKSQPKPAENIESLRRERDESLAREAAASDILRMIASSPTDLQPVLDIVVQSAARLCEATDASLYRLEDNVIRHVAMHGTISAAIEVGETRTLSRSSASGRAIVDRQTVHVHDMLADGADEYSDVWRAIQRQGIRTVLAVPMLRQGVPVGAIAIRRTEV